MRIRRRERAAGDEDGFTLIEVMVSFVIFAASAGAATTAIVSATTSTKFTGDQSTAASLAQSDLQQARALEYPDYPAAAAARKITVQGMTFTLTRTVSATCPSVWTTGQPTSMVVTSTVTWTGARKPIAIATEIAC